MVPCRKCRRRWRCPERVCDGSGFARCMSCYGTGWTYDGEDCPGCSGSGREPCAACRGWKAPRCAACNDFEFVRCPRCRGRVYELCEVCRGRSAAAHSASGRNQRGRVSPNVLEEDEEDWAEDDEWVEWEEEEEDEDDEDEFLNLGEDADPFEEEEKEREFYEQNVEGSVAQVRKPEEQGSQSSAGVTQQMAEGGFSRTTSLWEGDAVSPGSSPGTGEVPAFEDHSPARPSTEEPVNGARDRDPSAGRDRSSA
ncbi:MAG: hypothetical protein KatS3mg077_3285 [Candidatus Binatia bacterium]|nr:MAG: hypothetical protein KatS3mg077_3285 [Candidatus Binatia bacterium]